MCGGWGSPLPNLAVNLKLLPETVYYEKLKKAQNQSMAADERAGKQY